MRTYWSRAWLCALAIAIVGCSRSADQEATPRARMQARSDGRQGESAAAAPAPAVVSAGMLSQPSAKNVAEVDSSGAAPEAPLRRYLALRHELQILTPAESVESAWRRANEACAAAGCEVLASMLARDDERRPAQASLEARVPPEKFDAFLNQVTALGAVGHHSKTAEDKTDEVIDTEARLKNLSAFRDNLRRLMATPGARLKDLIEVERELVRVQSDLDSLASRRKALASETDKIHVMLTFVPRPELLETGIWSPVRDAVVGAGRAFARSVGGLIQVVVVALPWMIAVLIGGWAVRAFWRRRRARSAD